MNENEKHYGRLRAKTHRKKTVDEWTFYSPFVEHFAKGEGYTAKIEMRNGYSEGLHFVALSKHFAPIADSDIKRLREKVEKAFQIADMSSREIVWEDWVEITMAAEHYWRDQDGADLRFEWEIIPRGVHPKTGEAFTINKNNKVVIEFPKPKRAGESDQPKGDKWHIGSRDVDTQFSYIPATPANLAALKALKLRIIEARNRLRVLLNQRNAQASLADATVLKLEGPK